MKLCILAQVTSVHLGLSFLRFYPIYHFGYFCVLLQNIFILLWYSRFKGLEVRGEKKSMYKIPQFFFPLYKIALWCQLGALFLFFPPAGLPHHPTPLGCYRAHAWVSETYSKFLLAIYFTYGIVSLHVTLFIHFTLSSTLPMSISLFSMSVFPLLSFK